MEEGVFAFHILLDELFVLVGVPAADHQDAVGCLHPPEAVIPFRLHPSGSGRLLLLRVDDACFHRTKRSGLFRPELFHDGEVSADVCFQTLVHEDRDLVLFLKVDNDRRILRIHRDDPFCGGKVALFDHGRDILPGKLLTCGRKNVDRLLDLAVMRVDDLRDLRRLGDLFVEVDDGCFLLFSDPLLFGEFDLLLDDLLGNGFWIERFECLRKRGEVLFRLADKRRDRERSFRVDHRIASFGQPGEPAFHRFVDRAKLGIGREFTGHRLRDAGQLTDLFRGDAAELEFCCEGPHDIVLFGGDLLFELLERQPLGPDGLDRILCAADDLPLLESSLGEGIDDRELLVG